MLLQFIKFHKSKGTFDIYTYSIVLLATKPYFPLSHKKKTKNLKGIMVSKIISNLGI